MNIIIKTLAIIAILTPISCSNKAEQNRDIATNNNTETTLPIGDCSMTSLDWIGTYSNDSISIILNHDNTFEYITFNTKYNDKFVWDSEGNSILINHNNDIYIYKVCENYILSNLGVKLYKK